MNTDEKSKVEVFDGSEIFDLIRSLRPQLRLVLAVAIVAMALATALSLRSPKVYEAVTAIEYVPNPARPMGSAVEDVTENYSNYWIIKEFYETQNRVLKSRALAEQVVEALSLHENLAFIAFRPDPGPDVAPVSVETAAMILQSRLTVHQVLDSRIVELRVRDTDPQRAAVIANTLAETYILKTQDDRLATTDSALEWLEGQVRELRDQVDTAERALHEFKTEHNILSISLADRQNVIARTIEKLTEQLTTVRMQRIELDARVEQLKAVQKKGPLEATSPIIDADQEVSRLRGRIGEKASELAAASERYGENHPVRISLEAELASLNAALARSVERIVGATRSHREEIRDTERGLQRALEEAHAAGLELNRLEIDYQRLTRERDNAVELYKSLLERAAHTKLNRLVHVARARLVDEALPPQVPIAPRVVASAGLGLLGGLALGLVLAILRLRMDRTIRTGKDVEDLGLPLLGVLPEITPAPPQKPALRAVDGGKVRRVGEEDLALAVLHSPRSIAAECCRSIRTSLAFMSPEAPIRSMVVTSQRPREGKTTVAVSLALSIAISGKRVLLIDTDLRRPRIHQVFGLPLGQGTSTVLAGQAELAEVLQPGPTENLSLLSAGPIPPNPSELFHSSRFAALVAEAHTRFDVVIFDSPPLGAVTDAAILAHHVDGTLLVARSGITPTAALRASVRRIEDVDAKVLGCVLNGVDLTIEGYGGEAYPYYVRGYYETDDATTRTAG